MQYHFKTLLIDRVRFKDRASVGSRHVPSPNEQKAQSLHTFPEPPYPEPEGTQISRLQEPKCENKSQGQCFSVYCFYFIV